MCVASLSNGSFSYEKLPNSDENKPPPATNPPPSSHVVEIPKEQIRPGEIFERWAAYCLIALSLILAAFVSAICILSGIGFASPAYTVTKLAVHGANPTSSPPISPRFDVTIRVENPNGRGGIQYFKHGAVSVYYDRLCLGSGGVLADFYQPKKNVTVLQTALTASDDFVDGVVETALRYDERVGKVPLQVYIEAPYEIIKVGFVKTWKYTPIVACAVVLNKFNEEAKIISTNCSQIWYDVGW